MSAYSIENACAIIHELLLIIKNNTEFLKLNEEEIDAICAANDLLEKYDIK